MVNQALAKALASAVVRWLMVLAGAHGIDLGDEQANAAVGWLETGINGLLIVLPLVWSGLHKVTVDKQING